MKSSAAILCLCLSLSSCGLFRGKPEPVEVEEPTQPAYIGQITSIHAAQGFVLIRRAPGVTIPSGTILISRGPAPVDGSNPSRVANLRVSGETLGLMTAADIQSGVPEVGDSVHAPLLKQPKLSSDSASSSP